jgi:NitT/TauT family transport system permease protein/sulfonate transport system permease protein
VLRSLRAWWLVAVLALAWEGAVAAGLVRAALLPPPSTVVASLGRALWSGHWIADVGASVTRVIVGVLTATVAGVAAGAAVATSARARQALTPIVELVRPIPPIAWIPLAIVWLGIGSASAIFIVALGAFFPIFTGVQTGISSVRTAHVNAARGLGAGRRLILTDVLLPAALPSVVAGIRTGLGVGWMTVIAAELVGAQSGLGYLIQLSRIMLRIEDVIAGMVTIGAVGFLMNRIVSELGRRSTPWTGDTLVAHHEGGRHGRDD